MSSNGTMSSAKVRIQFKLDNVLILGVWISFKGYQVWVEIKHGRLPHFCYCRGVITYETMLCDFVKDLCIGFGGKNARLGECIRSEMRMVVPQHVKEGMMKKSNGDGSGSMKKVGENVRPELQFQFSVILESRVKAIIVEVVIATEGPSNDKIYVISRKKGNVRPMKKGGDDVVGTSPCGLEKRIRKELENISFLSNLQSSCWCDRVR